MKTSTIIAIGAIGIGFVAALYFMSRQRQPAAVFPVSVDPAMRDYDPTQMWDPTIVYSAR